MLGGLTQPDGSTGTRQVTRPRPPFTRGRFLGNAALKATPVGANSTLRFAHMAQQPGALAIRASSETPYWLAGRDRPALESDTQSGHVRRSREELTHSQVQLCRTARLQSTKAPHAIHQQ